MLKRLFTILVLLVAGMTHAALLPPTNFRTDPSDFTDLALPVGAIGYQFRWTDNDPNQTGVQIEVSTNNVAYFVEKILPGAATAYDAAQIPWTSNRWYRIKAISATDSSPYTTAIKGVGNMPPTNLGGTSPDITHVTVTWATAGGYLTGYTVQQATSPDFSTGLIEYGVAGQSSTSFTINYAFVLNQVYYFRVGSTNSNAGTGNSDFMNKPISYLSVAPNGPPVQPNYVTENIDQNANEALIFFDDVSLNSTAELLQYSTNGGSTWFTVPVTFIGNNTTRYTVTHSGLTGGMFYQYRLASTNSLGNSPFATWTFTPPAATTGGPWTTWYVDLNATGNSTGTNWANAWTGLGSINWPVLGPGHTVFISGGNYTNYIITYTDGAYGNPILLKTSTNSPHNGLVSMNGQIAWKSSYVTIDGGKNVSYTPTKAEDTNNINLQCIGRNNNDSGVFTVVARGAVLKYTEVTGTGNPSIGEGFGDGLLIQPTSIGVTNCFFFNCYVHDNFGSAINEITTSGYDFPNGIVFGMCYFNNWHNNAFACGNAWTATNCFWGGWKGPGVAHPDGVQGGFENSTFANNRMNWNCPSGSAIYMDVTGSTSQRNQYWVNNLFYGQTLDMQYAIITAGTPLIISNMWFVGNTFVGTNQASLAFVTGSTTGRVVQASHMLNNIFYTWTNGFAGNGGFSSGGTEYSPSDLEFNYNVLTGTGVSGGGNPAGGKALIYRTNNTPGIGAAGVFAFTNAEQFNAWSSLYKNNTSKTNQFEQIEAADYRLYGGDTVAHGTGTNVPATSLVPFVTNDLYGSTRTGSFTDMGYALVDPSLVLYYNFESMTNGRGGWLEDRSGNTNHSYAVTNATLVSADGNYCPTNLPGFVGNWAGDFRLKGTNEQNARYGGVNPTYEIGDWFILTNWNNIDFLTNGTWCTWVMYTNLLGINDSTLWSGEFINSPSDDNTWAISAYANGFEALSRVTNGARVDRVQWGNPTALPTNQWIHLAVTWQCTNGAPGAAIGYTNGVPFVTNAINAPYLHLAADASPHNVLIGAMTFGVDGYMNNGHPNNGWFTGLLDEFRIYNRALSGAQVAAVFGGGGTASGGSSPPADPAITVQPHNSTVTAPAITTFSVTATGSAPLTYQWYKNAVAIPGATSSSYVTPPTTFLDNGSMFYVAVTSAVGGPLNSNQAILTVLGGVPITQTLIGTGNLSIGPNSNLQLGK